MSEDYEYKTYKISKFVVPPDMPSFDAKITEEIRQAVFRAFELGIEQAFVEGDSTTKSAWKDARKRFFLPEPALPRMPHYNLPCYLPSPFERFKNNLLKWIKESGVNTESMERMNIAINSSIFTREWKDAPISTWKEPELTAQYLFKVYKRIMNGES